MCVTGPVAHRPDPSHARGGGDFGGGQFCVGNSAFQIGHGISHTKSRVFRELPPVAQLHRPAKPYTPQHFWECPRNFPHKLQGLPRNFLRRRLPPRVGLGTKYPPPFVGLQGVPLYQCHHEQCCQVKPTSTWSHQSGGRDVPAQALGNFCCSPVGLSEFTPPGLHFGPP